MRAASLFLMCLLIVPTIAFAVDGVVEINQERALAGGVTPGDAVGFPIFIRKEGSYRLTGDLVVPDVDTSAIIVGASPGRPIDVTIDLNGFSILGPATCSRPQGVTECDKAGGGTGIDTGNADVSLSIRNGTVRGMGDDGIGTTFSGSRIRIEDVTAISNAGKGFAVKAGEIVRSRAELNGEDGFWGSIVSPLLLRDVTSLRNGGAGFNLKDSSRLVDCVADENDGDGVTTQLAFRGGNLVTGCVIRNNGGQGLRLQGNDARGGNLIDANTGLALSGGVKIAPSACGLVLCP